MKLDYLREFLVVAETLNYTVAAEKLFIAQSALSRHISILEEYVGAKLLDRNTRGVKLTHFGEIAYTEIHRVVKMLDTLKNKAALMQEGSSGVIRLGAPYYSMSYLDSIFPAFRASYPDITLEIVSFQPSQAYHALIDGSIDIALLFNHDYPEKDALVFNNIANEPLILVSLQGHPLSKAPEVSLKDLSGQTIVRFKNNYLSDFINTLLLKNHIDTKKVVFSDSIDTLPYSLLESNGVAIEPLSVRNMPRSELAYTPFKEEEMNVSVSMAHLYNTSNQAVFAFLELANEQMRH